MIEQDKNWDGHCTCADCYWNMWFPAQYKNIDFSTENSKICVSESLYEIKMQPNTNKCPGYMNYKEFTGHKKGEARNDFV